MFLEVIALGRRHAKAEKEVVFLLQTAGVEVEWRRCTINDVCEGRTRVVRVILQLERGIPSMVSADAVGMSLVDRETGLSSRAYIYAAAVTRVASESGVETALVLGTAIAHELGHVLGCNHSQRGIMRAVWTKEDMRMMNERGLRFSAIEQRGVRAAIRARSAGAIQLAKSGKLRIRITEHRRPS